MQSMRRAEQWGPSRRPNRACSPRTPTPTHGGPRTQEGATIQSSAAGEGAGETAGPQPRETAALPVPRQHPPSAPRGHELAHLTITPSWPCAHAHTDVHMYAPGWAWTLHPSPAPEVRRSGLRSRRRWLGLCRKSPARPWPRLPAAPESQMFSTWVGPPGSRKSRLLVYSPALSPHLPQEAGLSGSREALGPRACLHLHLRGHQEILMRLPPRGTLSSVLCDFCFFQKEEHRETQLSVKLHGGLEMSKGSFGKYEFDF